MTQLQTDMPPGVSDSPQYLIAHTSGCPPELDVEETIRGQQNATRDMSGNCHDGPDADGFVGDLCGRDGAQPCRMVPGLADQCNFTQPGLYSYGRAWVQKIQAWKVGSSGPASFSLAEKSNSGGVWGAGTTYTRRTMPPTAKAVSSESYPPVTLQCSCKCGACVFHVNDVNGGKKAPLQLVNCHCEACRRHAGAAWVTYVTKNGRPFSYKQDLAVSKENFREFEIGCKTLEKFAGGNSGAAGGGASTPASSSPGAAVGARKVMCKKCKSILLVRFGEDDCVVAAGSIDDGDYGDDDAGRLPVEELWPVKEHPAVLKSPQSRDFCLDERAGWYVPKAGLSEKKYRQREKQRKAGTLGAGSLKTSRAEVTGGCYCGAVKFEVKLFPPELQHCYCSMCRKLSGAPFQTWAWVYNKHLKWRDEQKQLLFEKTSGEGGRHFCKLCGTGMTIVYDDEKKTTTWLAAGCYDDMSLCEEVADVAEAESGEGAQGTQNGAGSNKANSETSSTRTATTKGSGTSSAAPSDGGSTTNSAPTSFASVPEEVGANPNSSDTEDPEGRKPNKSSVGVTSSTTTSTSEKKEVVKKKQLEYTWRRVYFVGHICCLSVQPWYRIPDHIGSERKPLAG
eukprot:g16763.t1